MSVSCSARLVQPFLKFVRGSRIEPELVPRDFWSTSADGRISLESALAMLDAGVERLRDEALGLKLGRSMRFGEGGAFDYAVRSAPSVRAAVDVAARYSRLHTTLKFGAPFFAYAFDRSYERAPMPGADAVLHAAHCERVDSLLAELSAALVLKARVERVIAREIQSTRRVTLEEVARALQMSPRTMSRRLEQEGTSFAEELDQARQALALSYLNDREVSLKEVAFKLGFSYAESFHRAFKRWTGETPLAYRKRAPAEG